MPAHRPFGDDAHLGADDYRALRDLVNAFCGLELGPDQRQSVERRLRERLAILGLDDFAEYVRYLRADPTARGELEEAVECLTTKETYFFREAYQLRAFREEIIPMLAKQAAARKRLTVWSAGCSTGEEVYSIASMLLDASELHGYELLVYGSDLSRRSLAHARRAIYGQSAFRATTPEQKRRWFVERPEGWLVADRVRQICHFGHLNLLEAERAPAVGRVDVVFCRNVLIYLDARARKRVIDLFHERLYPGGVLLLGHSESLLNVSTAFELLHLREDLAYRRPVSGFGFASPRPMRAARPATDAPERPSAPAREPSLRDSSSSLRDSSSGLRDSSSGLRDSSSSLRDSSTSLRDTRTRILERLARAEEKSDRAEATRLRAPETTPATPPSRPREPVATPTTPREGGKGEGEE
jgi:chemotaxis protein methyltransferase CheR